MSGILLYAVILFVKIFEVSMATLRIVLITKGEKVKGAFIGFFEVMIWVMLAATVLDNITSDPFKVVVYALGFAIGNYTGSTLEGYLAIGTTKIEAIVHKDHGKALSIELRKMGLAVTAVEAYGMTDRKEILILNVPRKKVKATVKLIQSYEKDVFITINEVKPIYGGYGFLRK
jgi:uncharacterized protein YebE (UPF0316 family)